MEDIRVEGNLGNSDHEKVEFRVTGIMHKPSRIATFDFRRVNFVFFNTLLREIMCVRALEGRGAVTTCLFPTNPGQQKVRLC